jgi:hypothetical protein
VEQRQSISGWKCDGNGRIAPILLARLPIVPLQVPRLTHAGDLSMPMTAWDHNAEPIV